MSRTTATDMITNFKEKQINKQNIYTNPKTVKGFFWQFGFMRSTSLSMRLPTSSVFGNECMQERYPSIRSVGYGSILVHVKASIYCTLSRWIRFWEASIGNQPAPYRSLSGSKCRKSLENVSRGLRPRPQKVSKKPRNKSTLQTLSGDSPETSLTVPETFLRPFGVRDSETVSRLSRQPGLQIPL